MVCVAVFFVYRLVFIRLGVSLSCCGFHVGFLLIFGWCLGIYLDRLGWWGSWGVLFLFVFELRVMCVCCGRWVLRWLFVFKKFWFLFFSFVFYRGVVLCLAICGLIGFVYDFVLFRVVCISVV